MLPKLVQARSLSAKHSLVQESVGSLTSTQSNFLNFPTMQIAKGVSIAGILKCQTSEVFQVCYEHLKFAATNEMKSFDCRFIMWHYHPA